MIYQALTKDSKHFLLGCAAALLAGIAIVAMAPLAIGIPVTLALYAGVVLAIARRWPAPTNPRDENSKLIEESVRVLLTNLNVTDAFSRTLRLVCQRLGALAGYVMLRIDDLDPDSAFRTEATYSGAENFEFPASASLQSNLTGRVANTNKPYTMCAEGAYVTVDGVQCPARGAISVPIRVFVSKNTGDGNAWCVGTVTLLFNDPDRIDKELEDILAEFASILGIAIAPGWHRRSTQQTLASTLELLVNMFEQRSEFTDGHSKRVSEVAVNLGKKLGLGPESLQDLRLGTLLHDVGKIAIPEHILNKPGKLSPEEYAIIRQHPVIGYEMCLPLKLPPCVLKVIRNHHENLNGTGYPDRLSSADLSLFLRIAAVADSFDAMCSSRAYRGRMELTEVLAELTRHAGTQFDSVVVEKLKDSINDDWLVQLYRLGREAKEQAA